MRILVIDDDAVFCRCLVEALAAQGHEAEGVTDALIGFERCLRQSYDVVICDVKMPLIPGTELLSELRRDRPKQPVILISAFADDELAALASQSGARLLSKPFEAAVLERTLKEAVAGRTIQETKRSVDSLVPAAITERS